MTDLFEITGKSLKTAVEGTFKNPGPWLLIALISAIFCYISGLYTTQLDLSVSLLSVPGILLIIALLVLTFIVMGAFVKTLKNEKPSFKNIGTTFKNGFLFTIVVLIYDIILMLLAAFLVFGVGTWGSLLTNPIDNFVYYVAIVFCWIIVAILFILVILITNPAIVNFARTGKFTSAFKITELGEMISAISWGKCILGTILQTVIFAVIAAVILAIAYLFVLIPVVGDYLGCIVGGLFGPFAIIFLLNFSKRLFEGVENE